MFGEQILDSSLFQHIRFRLPDPDDFTLEAAGKALAILV